MRDDSRKWAPPRNRAQDITAPGVTIRALAASRLTLISGPRALTSTFLPLVEWPAVATSESYAISLRRDRVLEVNGPAHPEGWNSEQGLAISEVTDGYSMVEITGANALDLLNRGTELDIATPSRSCSRLLFGMGVFLYRYQREDTYRVHVSAAHDEALWHAIRDAAAHLR